MKTSIIVGVLFALVAIFGGVNAWGCSCRCNCIFELQAYYGPEGSEFMELNPSSFSPQIGWYSRDVHGRGKNECGWLITWRCGDCEPKPGQLGKAPSLCKASYEDEVIKESKKKLFPSSKQVYGETWVLKKVETKSIEAQCCNANNHTVNY